MCRSCCLDHRSKNRAKIACTDIDARWGAQVPRAYSPESLMPRPLPDLETVRLVWMARWGGPISCAAVGGRPPDARIGPLRDEDVRGVGARCRRIDRTRLLERHGVLEESGQFPSASSPSNSSGVQVIGGSNPAPRQSDSSRGRIVSLAMCFRFHVIKYSIPFTAATDTWIASSSAPGQSRTLQERFGKSPGSG